MAGAHEDKSLVKLDDALEKVCDEQTFLKFIQLLSEDWVADQQTSRTSPDDPSADGCSTWENGTIGAFLEAAAACGVDNAHKGGIRPDANPWLAAAAILLAGKYYE